MLVQFGEKAPFAFSVRATKCVSARDSDSAYCVLPDDERLKQVPTVPVLHGCEYTKFMKAGAKVLGVGFGDTRGTGPRGPRWRWRCRWCACATSSSTWAIGPTTSASATRAAALTSTSSTGTRTGAGA